jgi:hypothetical protein
MDTTQPDRYIDTRGLAGCHPTLSLSLSLPLPAKHAAQHTARGAQETPVRIQKLSLPDCRLLRKKQIIRAVGCRGLGFQRQAVEAREARWGTLRGRVLEEEARTETRYRSRKAIAHHGRARPDQTIDRRVRAAVWQEGASRRPCRLRRQNLGITSNR